jgi:hypothetical protein
VAQRTITDVAEVRSSISAFDKKSWKVYISESIGREKTATQHVFADNVAFGRDWFKDTFIQGAKNLNKKSNPDGLLNSAMNK